jgi:DNA-binding transcriptional LysR family regulator
VVGVGQYGQHIGRLVRLLPTLEGRSRPFSIIYPPHRQLSPASRVLIDFLVR